MSHPFRQGGSLAGMGSLLRIGNGLKRQNGDTMVVQRDSRPRILCVDGNDHASRRQCHHVPDKLPRHHVENPEVSIGIKDVKGTPILPECERSSPITA